jgi:hypothetical protein
VNFIKEFIHRRIPHIIGSYLFAGTSLILFVNWLLNRYSLPEYYTTLCLFGVIAIIPSVVILAYFHGAPGKDEWENYKSRNIKVIIEYISDIKQKLENKFYNERTTSNMDDMTYYMEVIEVQDSIAYAKITGSKWPVFKVRENDLIFISK